jgi:hypothetical protein
MAEKTDGVPRGSIDQLSRDNVLRLHENQKQIMKLLGELQTKITTLEKAHHSLQGDIQNTKQLVAFVQGQGIGSTVKRG